VEVQSSAILFCPKTLVDKDEAWRDCEKPWSGCDRKHTTFTDEEVECGVLAALQGVRNEAAGGESSLTKAISPGLSSTLRGRTGRSCKPR